MTSIDTLRTGISAALRALDSLVPAIMVGAVGALALGIGGCGAPEDAPLETTQDAIVSVGGNLGNTSNTATLGTAPPTGDTASTVTFFSAADLGGDALTMQVGPINANENVNPITFNFIEGANLVSRISSVRLVCGSRASDITLLDFPNTGPVSNWWGFGKGFTLSCTPNQMVTSNLHVDAPDLADNVASAYFLAHARSMTKAPFSSFVASNWNDQSMGDNATANGDVQLQMMSSVDFTLRQNLSLDTAECGAHDAFLILEVIMNQDETFTVYPKQTYVDEGLGDLWGCRDGMETSLASGAIDASNRLAAALPAFLQLVGNHPRYYFAPDGGMGSFMLAGGGDRVKVPAPSTSAASIRLLAQ